MLILPSRRLVRKAQERFGREERLRSHLGAVLQPACAHLWSQALHGQSGKSRSRLPGTELPFRVVPHELIASI